MYMKIVNKYYKRKTKKNFKKKLEKGTKIFLKKKKKKGKKSPGQNITFFLKNKKKTKHKRNIKFTYNSKIEVLKNLLDMEMH